jgi:MoxR-like ATPase
MMKTTQTPIAEAVNQASAKLQALLAALQQTIIGQDELLVRLLTALLANGHVLIEGLPGLGKTLLVKHLAKCLGGTFSRLQFTPDLLPSDLIGATAYQPETHSFTTRLGPVNANLVLADEINRAPAKTQSALLEAMQERQVSLNGETLSLPKPFFVVATQNPLEQTGTYPLPEAQKDRFLFLLKVTYPDRQAERRLLLEQPETAPMSPQPVLSCQELLDIQRLLPQIYADERILEYILDITAATRPEAASELSPRQAHCQFQASEVLDCGASPRASLGLLQAAKASALLQGRHFVLPEDVKATAPAILEHRLILNYRATAQGLTAANVISQILDDLQAP